MVDRLSNSMNNDLGQGYLNESFASMQSVYTYSNQNLASIVNMPQTKTTQMLEGFRSMITSTRIYKQIEDKGSKMFTGKSGVSTNYSGLSEDTLHRITIDVSEFNEYKTRINDELSKYINQKRIDQESTDIMQTINLSELLLRCYKNVPSLYFDQNFHFDFKGHLSREAEQMNNAHEKIYEYLEEVDLNLFYQIQSRFNEFLGIILDMNEMQTLIDDCLVKIQFIRKSNLILKQKLVQKGNQIVTIKKRIVRCQSLLALLQLAQTLHKSLPSIATLINVGKFDFAVALLHQTEAEYNHKFQKMISLNTLRDAIFLNRQKLEKNISMSFMDKSLDYVISELNFIKEPSQAALNQRSDSHSADNSFDDSSYINSTLMNETFETNQNHLNLTQIMNEASKQPQLKWQHTVFRRDTDLEEHISRIVNQSYDLDKFNNQNYRRKLIEMLKGFREGLLSDMQDYCQADTTQAQNNKQILLDINNENNNNNSNNQKTMMFENMNVDLFVRFVLFYSEILKRVALKQMGLNNTLLNSLVHHVINNLLQKTNDLDDNINAFSKLTSCVDDIYQNVIQLFKYINDWIDHLIKQKKLDNEVSILHFRRISKILTFWDDFLINEVPTLFKISSAPFDNNQACKESKEFRKFFRKFNEYHTKISMKSLETIRIEMEKKFLDQFHKKQLKDFKEILNNEKWVPVDINFEFYDIITYIVQIPDQGESSRQRAKSSFDEEEEDKSQQDEVIEKGDEKGESENMNDMTSARITREEFKRSQAQIKISKNQISFKNQTYRLTSAFLSLLKMIYEYMHLIDYFKTMRDSSCKKLFELLRFYNTYANELIIGCGAFNYGVQITARNIALSSVCLLFAINLFPQLKDKLMFISSSDQELRESVDDQYTRLNDEYTNHNNNIFKTIADILNKEVTANKSSLLELKWNNSKDNIKNPTTQTLSILQSYRQMYNVLIEFYEKQHITRIYAAPLDHLIKTYLPIFNTIQITNKLGAKRIKDEIEYSVDNMKNQEYMKLNPDLFKQFEEQAEDIIHERCMPYIQGIPTDNE